MSQVAAKKKLKIHNERVSVSAHFHEHGSVLKGDAEGFCDGFEVTISIDSEEMVEAISELMRVARRMCFTEKALTGETSIQVIQVINGQGVG